MGFAVDIWLWIGGAIIAFVLGIAAFRTKVRAFISELDWWGKLVSNPKEAAKDLGPGGLPHPAIGLLDVYRIGEAAAAGRKSCYVPRSCSCQ